MNRDFNYETFLKDFSSLQQKMLFLEKENCKYGFGILFDRANSHFRELNEQNSHFHKGDKNFFIKKQTELILKYLYELGQQNENLEEAVEKEIIQLFEKQYKLKKILQRLIDYIKKN